MNLHSFFSSSLKSPTMRSIHSSSFIQSLFWASSSLLPQNGGPWTWHELAAQAIATFGKLPSTNWKERAAFQQSGSLPMVAERQTRAIVVNIMNFPIVDWLVCWSVSGQVPHFLQVKAIVLWANNIASHHASLIDFTVSKATLLPCQVLTSFGNSSNSRPTRFN